MYKCVLYVHILCIQVMKVYTGYIHISLFLAPWIAVESGIPGREASNEFTLSDCGELAP